MRSSRLAGTLVATCVFGGVLALATVGAGATESSVPRNSLAVAPEQPALESVIEGSKAEPVAASDSVSDVSDGADASVEVTAGPEATVSVAATCRRISMAFTTDSPAGYLPLSLFGSAPIPMGDEQLLNFSVPSFRYNGKAYTQIAFSSNGFAVPGGGTVNSFENQFVPDPDAPNNVLAPLWADLNPTSQGAFRVTTLTDGVIDWLVAEWENVPLFGSTQANSFQIWIRTGATEQVYFTYKPGEQVNITPSTVGAEDALGQNGATTYFNFPHAPFDIQVLTGTSTAKSAFSATPSSGAAPLNVTFNAGASSSTGGSISGYSWNFGDGSTASGASLKTTTHQYSAPGTYQAKLQVIDSINVKCTAAVTITVGGGAGAGLSVNDVSVNEGAGTASFTVKLGAPKSSPVSVVVATADGTAKQPADYTKKTATVTFPAGVTSKTFVVTVKNDTAVEPAETFRAVLSNPTGAAISDGTGVATIVDNDSGPVSIRVGDAAVDEGDAGTTAMRFTVTLSRAATSAVTVHYATANGTATAPSDFAAASGQLAFSAGQTSKQVVVNVKGDNAAEPNEGMQLRLSAPTGATIGDGVGAGTIRNDD